MSILPRLSWRQRLSKTHRKELHLAKAYVRSLESEGKIRLDGKVLLGRDGWLFLANDSNDAIAQHSGTRRFPQADLERWSELLQERATFLNEMGCHYQMLVAPDTQSLYPEKLPVEVQHARERPVHQLMDQLEAAPVRVPVLYPIEQMKAQKDVHLVCSPIDTHWTDFGAFVAYSALLDELPDTVSVRRLTTNDVVFREVIAGGDLGGKFSTPRLSTLPVAILRYRDARLLYDNCIENTGSMAITECKAAPPTTCLLVGDSYSYSLVKFLSESFGRLVLAHSASLDRNVVDQVEPDVVVNEIAERFLIKVPNDDPGILAALERDKRANGWHRPPLNCWYGPFVIVSNRLDGDARLVSDRAPGYRWPTPADAERLRAHFLADGNVRDATIVSVLAYGGLRPEELFALRWPDVGERELVVRKPGQRIGEGEPARRVPMVGPLADDLRGWEQLQHPHLPRALVVPGSADQDWGGSEWSNWCWDVFGPAVSACGLGMRYPDEFRHTFCRLLLYEGVPVREVARRVGEKKRVIKDLYGPLIEEMKVLEPADSAAVVREIRRAFAVPAPEVAVGEVETAID